MANNAIRVIIAVVLLVAALSLLGKLIAGLGVIIFKIILPGILLLGIVYWISQIIRNNSLGGGGRGLP